MRYILFLLLISNVKAEELNLAVSANFVSTMEKIKTEFEKKSSHQLLLSSGASGKLFAQIKAKAPFDLYLSADNVLTPKAYR